MLGMKSSGSINWNAVSLLAVLMTLIILRLTNGISSDATETQLGIIIGAMMGGSAVVVGTKLGEANKSNGKDHVDV
jgi:hypothetical protein